METRVQSPQTVFMQPQRLVVPLFQRPYVWSRENQWEPLWGDVVRLAERLLAQPHQKHFPHFLGAVVLQQVQNPMGSMQERTIIDGQQRLTTLQILFDALHAELVAAKAEAPAMRLEPLVVNAAPFCARPEDRFKVWPTNRDRPAFNAVMGAAPPVDYGAVGHAGHKMVEAHRYFAAQAREWLAAGGEGQASSRGAAIETCARELLQVVVIDLGADENAQEIFETLNARGAPLTAADLIKNFVFQRLHESGADVEQAYDRYWKDFETAFWEAETTVGRFRYSRASVFFNHWLVARTGREVVAREVFNGFKRYATHDAGQPMRTLVEQLDRAADVYRRFVEGGDKATGPVDRLGLFAYRTGVLESEVVKPLVLALLDPEKPPVPDAQLRKALAAVESWMVRRMLMRATTKNYNQVVAELIEHLSAHDRAKAGDAVEQFLAGQTSASRYWPDDDEIRQELRLLPAYRRLGRGRLRMVLEAVEDHLRGWHGDAVGLGGERVARGKFAIEHVMPRKWAMHWPLPGGAGKGEVERDAIIHTIGNLTLLTGRLNSKVSNGPWNGADGKRHGLQAHDVLLLNRRLLDQADKAGAWTDEAVRKRSEAMADLIVEIWPSPPGHRSGFAAEKAKPKHRIDLSDLLSAGWLKAGASLTPRRKKHAASVATLLSDGRIDINGDVHADPSEAARSLVGKPVSGWWFFLVDPTKRRSLKDVRFEYLASLSEAEGDDEDDDEDDES